MRIPTCHLWFISLCPTSLPLCSLSPGIIVSETYIVTKLPYPPRGRLGEKPDLDWQAACTVPRQPPPWSCGSSGRDITSRVASSFPWSSLRSRLPAQRALLHQEGLQGLFTGSQSPLPPPPFLLLSAFQVSAGYIPQTFLNLTHFVSFCLLFV